MTRPFPYANLPITYRRPTGRQRAARHRQNLSGNVWVNSFNILPPGMPFGGARHSGFGRENSISTLDAYSEVKSVHITL
jgi:acyl-CoA reductase-like NAD-dependent aldehyde dehydrogenase